MPTPSQVPIRLQSGLGQAALRTEKTMHTHPTGTWGCPWDTKWGDFSGSGSPRPRTLLWSGLSQSLAEQIVTEP